MKKYHSSLTFKSLIIHQINIGILIFMLIFSYLKWNVSIINNDWSVTIAILSLTLIIYQFLIFYIMRISILDFKFIFILLSHLFLFGQIYLIAFGYENDLFYNVILRYPAELIFKSGLFSLCYIQAIFIGFMYQPKSNSHSRKIFKNLNNKKVRSLTFKTGVILTVLSIPFELYVDFANVMYAQSNSAYTGGLSLSGISTDIAVLFIPGILLIICSGYLDKKVAKTLFLTVIVYLLGIMILSGDRRYYFTGIIALILGYLQISGGKLKMVDFIKYGILGVLLLNIITIIRYIRTDSLTSIGGFFSKYGEELLKSNPLFETLNEFGVTILSVSFPIKYFPEMFDFQNGLSFIGSIPSLLPVGWIFGDFFEKVGIVTQIINPLEGYPVGGSLPGDLYANFGWWGVLGAIISGLVLSKIFKIDKNTNTFEIAIYYSAFYILINLVRATFIEIFRNTFIVIFIPVIVFYILRNNGKFKKK